MERFAAGTGRGIFAATALLATLVLVMIANTMAFSHGSVNVDRRFALILILAIAGGGWSGVAVEPDDTQERNR